MNVSDVTAILLTHIHLDHSGATGTLVRERPGLKVYVHHRGAPHMANPDKLIASATRLYGSAMDAMWGECAPVPPEVLQPLWGGERIAAGGRDLDVAYTPGHASHHVSYFNADTRLAFVGDTAGVMAAPSGFVLPPTPPPDIDLDLWDGSLSLIEAWRADTLFLTHFGPASRPAVHLTQVRDHLALVAGLSKRAIELHSEESDREAWFTDALRHELRRHMSEGDALAYETSARFDLNWRGLARYWNKKSA